MINIIKSFKNLFVEQYELKCELESSRVSIIFVVLYLEQVMVPFYVVQTFTSATFVMFKLKLS